MTSPFTDSVARPLAGDAHTTNSTFCRAVVVMLCTEARSAVAVPSAPTVNLDVVITALNSGATTGSVGSEQLNMPTSQHICLPVVSMKPRYFACASVYATAETAAFQDSDTGVSVENRSFDAILDV